MKCVPQGYPRHTTPTRRLGNWVGLVALVVVAGNPATVRAAEPGSAVPYEQALADARNVAALHPNFRVYAAAGESMAPQFGDASLLLVAPTIYSGLRAGMVVVYRDAAGDLVAHRLIGATSVGWTAKGFNNERADPGLVTKNNLVGVLFGILHYKPGTEKVGGNQTKPEIVFAKRY